MSAELILHNAKIATNEVPSFVEAIAIAAGRITAVGKDDEILRLRGPQTRVIDGRRRTVDPWSQRFTHASDSGRAQLQLGIALGWCPVTCGCPAHVEGAGCTNARASVGTGGRRMDGIPVCRTPYANAR